jgi:CBS domain-containing protein
MHVLKAMSPNVHTIDPQASLVEIAQCMSDNNVGVLPVVEDYKVVGLVTDRDIITRAIAQGADPTTTTAADVMTRDVQTVADYQTVHDVEELMRRKHIRRVVVLDRNNHPVGIVSLDDLATRVSTNEAGQVLKQVCE